jgi:hypothetical protein
MPWVVSRSLGSIPRGEPAELKRLSCRPRRHQRPVRPQCLIIMLILLCVVTISATGAFGRIARAGYPARLTIEAASTTIVIEAIRPSAMVAPVTVSDRPRAIPGRNPVMTATPRLPKGSIPLAACGACTGWWATAAMRPYLRAIDPIGYSPIILICLLGGMVLFWYLRRCSQARVKA